MWIYFLLLIIVVFLGLSELKYKNGYIFIVIFLFSALRFDVGYDYISYYNVINYLDEINYLRFGFIDKLLIDISRQLNFYQFYFIITSFLITYLITKTLNKFSENYFFSILLFLSIPIFYLLSFSIIRQFVALALVFYSIKYIMNKNLFKFIILIFISATFHISAIAAMPIYFLYRIKFSKIFAWGLIFSSIVMSSLFIIVLETYIPIYATYIYDSAKHGKSLLYFFILVFIFLMMNYKYIRGVNASFFFNTFTVGVFLYSSTIRLGEVAPRVSYYYLIFLLLLIPTILKFYKQKQMYFIMLLLCITLYSFNFYLFAKNENKNAYIPYNIFLLIDEKNYNWK